MKEILILEKLLLPYTNIYKDMWFALENYLLAGKSLVIHKAPDAPLLASSPLKNGMMSGAEFFQVARELEVRVNGERSLPITSMSGKLLLVESKVKRNGIYGAFPQVLLLDEEIYQTRSIGPNLFSLKLITHNRQIREMIKRHYFQSKREVEEFCELLNLYLLHSQIHKHTKTKLSHLLENLNIFFPKEVGQDQNTLDQWVKQNVPFEIILPDVQAYYEAQIKASYGHDKLIDHFTSYRPAIGQLIIDLNQI